MKRVSTGFVMVNGFGFQLLYGGVTGKIEITLDPFYTNKVRLFFVEFFVLV